MLPSSALSRRQRPFSVVIALLVIFGMLVFPVTSAMAASAQQPAFRNAPVPQIPAVNTKASPIVGPETWQRSLDRLDPSIARASIPLSLSPAVNATSTITVSILSTPFATHDSNSNADPSVWLVEAVITNTGANTLANPSVDLNMNPDGNWFLLPGEVRQRNLSLLVPPGGTSTIYWFAHRSDTIPDPHTYTVTAWANNATTVTQSVNVYPNTFGQTVESRSSLGTGNNGIVSTSANVVVGVAFTMTVDYNLGINPLGVTLQPNGTYTQNGAITFDPSAFSLLSSTVQFRDAVNTPVGPLYADRLYFPEGSLPSGAQKVTTSYTFVPLRPANVQLCPYTDVLYSGNPKHDQFYCNSSRGTIVPITGTLSISFTKSVNAATVQQGQLLTYTLRYTNTGNFQVHNSYIWDNIPSNTITSTVTPSPDPTPGFNTPDRVVWNIGTIAPAGSPGSTGVVTLTVLVNGRGADIPNGTPLVNTGYFGVRFDPSALESAAAFTTTTTVQAPTIAISKSDGQTNVTQGQALTYTLRVTNTGAVAASNMIITDVLPTGVTYNGGAVPAPGGAAGQTLTWSVPSLVSGVYTITVPVTVNYKQANGTQLINSMLVRYLNPSGYPYTVLLTTDVDTVQSPILAITKTSNPNPAIVGRNIIYTLQILNTGPAVATNVVVTDVVPVSTTFVSCNACTLGAGNVVSWSLPSLAANASAILTLTINSTPPLVSGSAIVNQTYGVVSDQTNFVAGAPQTTTVFNASAKVIGRAFVDVNTNGLLDSGEVGIPNVPVTLTQALTPTTVTDANGYYTFTVEEAGNISVAAGVPTGYFRTTASPVYLNVTLETTTTVNFGYITNTANVGVIYGTVFNDLNHNGVQELGEPGLSGVSLASPGALSTPVTTNIFGQYTFGYSSANTYTVTETNLAGYVSTTPDIVTQPVALNASTRQDFGDFLGVRIEGQVFNDLNANGVKDGGEPGLSGAVVSAGSDIATTGTSGNYVLFSTVQPGQPITITETDPAGYVSTAAIPGTGVVRIDTNTMRISSPNSGTIYTNNDFGNTLAAGVITITGQVFNDLNANGLYDDGGLGLADGRVTVSTGMFVTTTNSGNFTLYAPSSTVVTVTETNPAGYVSTNAIPGNNATKYDLDTLRIDALAAGSTSANNYFGDVILSSAAIVTGVLYNDANHNGVFDPGEGVFPGEIVQISGTASLITTTASDGSYKFAVGVGSFLLSSSMPAGYYRTTPAQLAVNTALGTTYPDRNFGFSNIVTRTTIYGTVFDDINGNGYQDLGELGLPGAQVFLISGTTAISNVTTGAGGTYAFSVAEPGPYRVFEVNPPGYFSTTPDQINLTVSLGNSYEVNFGDSNRTDVGSVHGVVFDDLNGNGIQDPGEPGIPGVVITTTSDVFPTVGQVISVTTQAQGQYSYGFDFVTEGYHVIHEQNKPNYRSTTPDAVPVFVLAGQSFVVDFGDCLIGACSPIIQGTVFDDVTGDGIQQFNELGIPGVTVTLYSGTTPIAQTTTRSNGDYTFAIPQLGSYRVVETDPQFYHSTTPNDVHVSVVVSDTYTVNFGDSQNPNVSSLFGTVFDDANVNGVFDLNEVGVANVPVQIVGNFSGSPANLTTNALGQYTYQVDQPGLVTITESDPPGYVSTTPNVLQQSVVLGESYNNNFGDVLAANVFTVTGSVWDDTTSPDGLRTTEPGLSGATVAVNTGMSTLTDGAGNYVLYAPGSAGTVTATETNPPGYISTGAITGTSGAVVVNADTIRIGGVVNGGASAGNQFGDALASAIVTVTGRVFNDVNANRADDAEPGLVGVTVSYPGGSTTTGANGVFSFYTTPGTFVVTETNPAGFVSTIAITGSSAVTLLDDDHVLVTASGGSTISGIEFGDYNGTGGGAIRIEGKVFNDFDNSHTDNGEPGIPGVTVSASGGTTTTTDSNGHFVLFAPSNAGPVIITETNLPGYVSTIALTVTGVSFVNNDQLRVDAPISGTTYSGVKFGDKGQSIQFNGLVFDDLNADGSDSGDPPLSGALVMATGGTSMTTGLNGTFTVYAPSNIGPITITEVDPAGYVSTIASAGGISVTAVDADHFVVAAPVDGAIYDGNKFGDFAGVQVLGSIFEDRNVNGVWDVPYEPVITTTSISLAGSGGLTAQTGATGVYTLYAKAVNGSITVTETVPAGYAATTPIVLTFPGAAGQYFSSKDFGLQPPTCGPDAYEALNDDLASTTGVTLTPGVPQLHNFHVYDDKDWAKVDLIKGYVYTFTASAVGLRADTVLALFAPDGVTQLALSDDVGSDFSSQITWTAAGTGTYYLRVTQANTTLAGCDTNYILSMSVKPKSFIYLPLIMKNYP